MDDKNSRTKVVLSLSGGLDSSTLLGNLIAFNYEVLCLNFIYGSHHNKYELESAKKIADYYKVPYKTIDLTTTFKGFKSNLLIDNNKEIPEGHYEENNMSKTVVPGRNTIFASILLGYAESIGAKYIALGIHKGDHHIYPDCRAEYIKALDCLVYLASDYKIEVLTPFINLTKSQICELGTDIQVPYELTRTCYKNQEISCGKCGSCNERLEAFSIINLKDGIEYQN